VTSRPLCEQVPREVEGLRGRRISLVSGGWRHTMAADDSGAVFAWGWNKFGQVRRLSAHRQQALLAAPQPQLWGCCRPVRPALTRAPFPSNLQLGLGDSQDRLAPTLVAGLQVRWASWGWG
jgi:hypothetical protein